MVICMAEEKRTIPLLIISDAVSAGTGLARITRDVATRVHEHMKDSFRVATFGYAGPGTSKCTFPQFVIEGMENWVLPTLPQVWDDFAGKDRGIIMFIWDLSRLTWFAQPQQFSELLDKFPATKKWLLSNQNFEKWVYAPLDASGPNDRLTFPIMQTLLGFDRILAYGHFGEDVIRRTIGDEAATVRGLTHLPHGIDSDMFFPLNQSTCRKVFLKTTGAVSLIGETKPLQGNELLIGCVATNQNRKDWALAIEAVSILAQTKAIRFWVHTNSLENHWSIAALLIDFGIIDKTVVSIGHLPDESMAKAYSACDVTIAPGLGEGFGYPIFESLFCGAPCVHGNYGGAPEWMNNEELLSNPIAYRYDGLYACKRPVFSPQNFAEKMTQLIGKRTNHPGEIDWVDLWPRWKNWFLATNYGDQVAK